MLASPGAAQLASEVLALMFAAKADGRTKVLQFTDAIQAGPTRTVAGVPFAVAALMRFLAAYTGDGAAGDAGEDGARPETPAQLANDVLAFLFAVAKADGHTKIFQFTDALHAGLVARGLHDSVCMDRFIVSLHRINLLALL
jgi:hypothetical protein